ANWCASERISNALVLPLNGEPHPLIVFSELDLAKGFANKMRGRRDNCFIMWERFVLLCIGTRDYALQARTHQELLHLPQAAHKRENVAVLQRLFRGGGNDVAVAAHVDEKGITEVAESTALDRQAGKR